MRVRPEMTSRHWANAIQWKRALGTANALHYMYSDRDDEEKACVTSVVGGDGSPVASHRCIDAAIHCTATILEHAS